MAESRCIFIFGQPPFFCAMKIEVCSSEYLLYPMGVGDEDDVCTSQITGQSANNNIVVVLMG